MIEAQEDLTWDRLFQLAQATEDLGFESMFRSDHLTALDGDSSRAALALWPSLTALALRTRRIRFGPLVCSVTFQHPSLIAKTAAAIDVLSDGRFELGIGAGWYRGEHAMFGLQYPPYQTRLEMLDEAAQVIRALWTGQPQTFEGRHYRLQQALARPTPSQSPPPLIMGGKNEQRTLRLVAQYATEWNCTYISAEGFARKSRVLDQHCAAIGRDPSALRRSLMLPYVVGRDGRALQERIDANRRTFPSLPGTLADWLAAGYVGGSPAQVADQLEAYANAGAQRILMQNNDLDDIVSLELLAAEVMPHFK
jgi:F420-dependent oxidoreductase-like protein